jgi:hypothetical protein
MKKLLQLITGGLIKDVGKVIDNLTTTDEERLAAKLKIEELLEQADKDAQDQVTARWESDMKSDSFLSKNIRPMVLIYLTFIFSVLAFFDGNIGEFSIAEDYIPIFQSLLITVYGAYFVGRTWEKGKKISNNK